MMVPFHAPPCAFTGESPYSEQPPTGSNSHPRPPVPHPHPHPHHVSLSDSYAQPLGRTLNDHHHIPERDYLQRCRDRFVDITAPLDAINWVLKVHAFYQFRPVTAFLAVNYMDRFLSHASLPQLSGWSFQPLSVACLSLAAKMEVPKVSLLLDLQLFETRFVFEPKTVQRMELRVMDNLDWRLRSVTPFEAQENEVKKVR